MTNNDLRFAIGWYLSNSPKDMSITDVLIGTSNYGGLLASAPNGETNADINGIMSINSPVGIIYQNTGFNSNDFSLEDISSSGATLSGVTLPLSGVDVMCGAYNFTYKIRLELLGTFVGLSSGKFSVQGDYTSLLGASPANLKFQIFDSTAGHNGTYNISSVVFNSPNTEITVSGSGGSFSADASDKIAIIFEISKPYNYCFTDITGSLELSSSCIFSQMTSEDTSDYDVIIGGTTYSPAITRSWNIQTPSSYSTTAVTGGSVNPFVIGYGTSVKSGANIWTGNYNVSMTASLTYNVDVWGSTNWQIIYDSVTLSDTIAVQCDNCFCNLFACVQNLFDKYNTYLGTNQSAADKLFAKIIRVLENWQLFQLAERCGKDTREFCNAISEIVTSENCQCPSTTTITSEEVIPLSLQTVGGSGSQAFTSGTVSGGFPTTPNINDHHLFTDGGVVGSVTVVAGDIYKYNGTSWVFVINYTGATGATGATGSNGTNGVNGASMVFNNTPTSVPTTVSTSYVAFTGMTTSALTNLVATGDRLVIDALFSTTVQGSGSKAKIQIDGTDIPLPSPYPATYEHLFAGSDLNARLQIVVDVQDFATKKIRVTVKDYGSLLGGIFGLQDYRELYTTMTTSSALNNIVIRAMGLSGDGVDVVSCQSLAITYFKK